HGGGTCEKTGNCVLSGFNVASHCPNDPDDVQCCVKKACSTPQGSGTCINTADKGSCKGAMLAGHCPGDDTIQCCVPGASTPAPPSGGGDGAEVVAAAVKKEGLPYVWGGGGCSGESSGGFDCSGLAQYAICQAVDKTIPRNTQQQYHSSMGTHMPRAEAKAGDMIFWAHGGDCANKVSHVGIFMRDGWMVNAAHSGTPVREQAIWTSSDGTSICPDAVRVGMSQPEILVHAAAPSHGPDDVRYRKEALGILGFEAFKSQKQSPLPRQQSSQDTQQSLAQAQDSVTSADPAPRHQVSDAFSTWMTPILPCPSPQILVGRTPAPLLLRRAPGLTGHVPIGQTPKNQQRPRTTPSETSIVQETPPARRSYSDAFETPPSEIPDSQPTPQQRQQDGEPSFEETSSPSPIHRKEPHTKKWKGDGRGDPMLQLGDGTPPDDTSTPAFNNEPPASSSPHQSDATTVATSTPASQRPESKVPAYRRRKVDPPPPETSLTTTMPSQLTSSLIILRQKCTKILEAVQPLRPIQDRERGYWRVTFEFDHDEAEDNNRWNLSSREKMWTWLESFISRGCGGWGAWATFEEGKLERFD
ncbi:MAG: hypothetical protein Q9205_006655, partial [Flavoplaca limonia]